VLTMSMTNYIEKKRVERREATMVQRIAILEAQLDELRGKPAGT
jgi:hypothetical protein